MCTDFEMQQQGEDETANPNEFEANDISPSPASSINSSQNSPNSFDDVGSSLPGERLHNLPTVHN